MNDEIKEILDIERYRNKDGYVENISLMPDEIHKLLDYITNLQQEKDDLDDYNRHLHNELKDYKSRNEKAIMFICKKDMEANLKGNAEFNSKELLDILQGSDKE